MSSNLGFYEEGYPLEYVKMKPERVDDYIKEVQSVDKLAQTESNHSVKRVLLGFEGDFYPDMNELADTLELYRTKPLDFIIGSLHHQNPLYRKLLISKGYKIRNTEFDHSITEQYFSDLRLLCESRLFDVCCFCSLRTLIFLFLYSSSNIIVRQLGIQT